MLLLLALLLNAPAHASRPFTIDRLHHPVAASPESVNYYGGPVISHVKTVIVYWGNGIEANTKTQLETFYRGLVTSSYMDLLSEFGTKIRSVDGREGTNQEVGRGTLVGAYTITPVNTSKRLNQADVERELEAQLGSGKLPAPDADTYYAIHYPDGYSISISFGGSCSSWYADHEVYRSKKFGPVYYAMMPCESADMSNFGMLTFASSHELVEAVTDPQSPLQGEPSAWPAGWLRSDAEEIADLCTGTRGTLSAGGSQFEVSGFWLNTDGGCRGGNFTAP